MLTSVRVIAYLVYPNIDYINENKLAQDHPCVIKLIRHLYLTQPSRPDVPYNFTDLSPGFVTGKREGSELEDLLLRNKVRNFATYSRDYF